MSMSTLGQGLNPRKNSSSTMDVAEDKGSNLLLVVTVQVIPRHRKSTKTEKDNREKRNVWGKGYHYCIQCLVPDIAMLFYLYNYSQQLEGRADGTSISTRNPIQEEGNYYKRGWREIEGGLKNPYHTRGTRKSSSDHAKDQHSLINPVHLNLIVKNTC